MRRLIEQLSTVLGIDDASGVYKGSKAEIAAAKKAEKLGRKKGRATVDARFADKHSKIAPRYRLQPSYGVSQHGPEQTIEGEETMASMAELIEKAEAKTKKPKLGTGERFKKLAGELEKKGAKDPKALAAWIGRKKYGPKKFAKLSAKGRAEDEDIVADSLDEAMRDVWGTEMEEDVDEPGGNLSGAVVGDTENNWLVVDTDSGVPVAHGFDSMESAEIWAWDSNLVVVPEAESHRMEKMDPVMLALKREHPNIVWVLPPSR